MKKPAIFLDRDGTLIEEVNYLSRVEDLRLFPFTAAAVKLFKDYGYLIIVLTNQSGIGRGIYDESAMHSIHRQMQIELSDAIDGFYFCPHLPCDGCACRKPGVGMISAAEADFEIDLANSWMVGDKKSDIDTGRAANIQTALVLTGYGSKHQALLEYNSDVISEDLAHAAKSIVESRLSMKF